MTHWYVIFFLAELESVTVKGHEVVERKDSQSLIECVAEETNGEYFSLFHQKEEDNKESS